MYEHPPFASTPGSSPRRPETPAALAPEVIVDSRYRLLREIGAGGGGVVYEAEHVHTGARVALKTLTQGAADPRRAERLLHEARIVGTVRHPNLVRILDAGECGRHGVFVAMALIRGRTLESFITARGRLDVPSVVAVVEQAADALSALDARGIVHGDVKPSNLLVSRGECGEPDHAVLVDFGVAKQTGYARWPDGRLTRDGDVVGTPEYMAPEQVSAPSEIDHRVDVYGLGALAYECLTGATPFSGSPLVVMSAIVSGSRPEPIGSFRSDVPPALEAAVMRALEVRPALRWPSAASFARACAAAVGGVPKLYVYSREEARPESVPPGGCRRQNTRGPYMAPGRVALCSGVVFDCRVEDISTGGLLVISATEVHPESVVWVKFPLPMSGKVVTLGAVVRWARPRAGGHAQGLELRDVPPEVRREIEVYLAPFKGTVSI